MKPWQPISFAWQQLRTGTTLCAPWLQAELGDVVYVELPEVGSSVKKGTTFGVVESVKVRFTGFFS